MFRALPLWEQSSGGVSSQPEKPDATHPLPKPLMFVSLAVVTANPPPRIAVNNDIVFSLITTYEHYCNHSFGLSDLPNTSAGTFWQRWALSGPLICPRHHISLCSSLSLSLQTFQIVQEMSSYRKSLSCTHLPQALPLISGEFYGKNCFESCNDCNKI